MARAASVRSRSKSSLQHGWPVSRRTVGEIKIRSAVPVKDFQKQVDQGAKELRQLEERIQELNWTTELLEG